MPNISLHIVGEKYLAGASFSSSKTQKRKDFRVFSDVWEMLSKLSIV